MIYGTALARQRRSGLATVEAFAHRLFEAALLSQAAQVFRLVLKLSLRIEETNLTSRHVSNER